MSICEHLTYPDVLETHKILFEAVYPWAGQDPS
jgi:fido (protein-threonine AMPylation protein)